MNEFYKKILGAFILFVVIWICCSAFIFGCSNGTLSVSQTFLSGLGYELIGLILIGLIFIAFALLDI